MIFLGIVYCNYVSANYLSSILESENPMQLSRKIVSLRCGRKNASLKPLILAIRFSRAWIVDSFQDLNFSLHNQKWILERQFSSLNAS